MTLPQFLHDLHTVAVELPKLTAALQTLATELVPVVKFLTQPTGINVSPKEGVPPMQKLTCTKKLGAKPARKFKAGDPLGGFVITDDPNSPGNFVVHGTNLAGDILDISSVATIQVSGTTGNAAFSVTGPASFSAQGVKQGLDTANITATWNDASVGPFSGTADFQVNPGPVSGLVVTPA